MKKIIFFFWVIYNFSLNAETYLCNLENNKNIIFDRTGHSHFKKCLGDICDKNIYPIIYLDKKFLIFGNIESKNDYFQIFIIDKKLNTYSDNKIKFPIINSINILFTIGVLFPVMLLFAFFGSVMFRHVSNELFKKCILYFLHKTYL